MGRAPLVAFRLLIALLLAAVAPARATEAIPIRMVKMGAEPGDPRAVAPLIEVLKPPHEWTERKAAAEALGFLRAYEAEAALIESLQRSRCEFTISPGEGAFYGPKIEYTLKDAIGRQWQCGTMQVDFSMPGRLGAEYVADDNAKMAAMLTSITRIPTLISVNRA